MVHLSGSVLLVAIPAFLISPLRTPAYLDPGTGSYVLQLLVAGLLGAALAIRIFWGRISAFFSRLRSRGHAGAQESPDVH